MVTEYKGKLDGGGLRIAIVVGRFNEFISRQLLDGALDALDKLGVSANGIQVAWAPGAFEIPLIARTCASSGQVDAVLCLGAVIRGETDHYRHVSACAARGIATVALECGLPVLFGILTVDTLEQAIQRAGAKAGNKGAQVARAAVETVHVLRQIKES